MAKKTYQSTDGTSFQGVVIRATVNQLISAFGEPTIVDNTGEDKTNYEWDMETNEGEVFCIYDWKEGRPLGKDEFVTWHIGAKSKSVSNDAEREILKALK
jgi:predicted secreted protein